MSRGTKNEENKEDQKQNETFQQHGVNEPKNKSGNIVAQKVLSYLYRKLASSNTASQKLYQVHVSPILKGLRRVFQETRYVGSSSSSSSSSSSGSSSAPFCF